MAPLKRGDRILIETQTSEIYEGNVSNKSKNSIELYNIYLPTTNTEYPGTCTFYRDEILTLTRIGDKSPSDEAEAAGLNGNYAEISTKIKLHPDEFDRLKEMTVQFIFIDTFGKKFNDAIQVLSNRESVAVAGLGSTVQKDKRLSLLVMSDFKQVYIFDMLCLVHLRDLKDILKSEIITKVVHGGETLFDCLYHKYKVEMVNVYDTQVVDSMLSKSENNVEVTRNLSECLNYHFNFPLALLAVVMEEMHAKTWLQRPLPKTNKIEAAHLVAYLLTLRDHLMKKVLKGYSDATLQKYTPYKFMTDLEVLTKRMSHNGIADNN